MLRSAIGGKSAGVYLIKKTLGSSGIDGPSPLLAITGRAYAEHIAPLNEIIQELINNDEFKQNPYVRALILEGWSGVMSRYAIHNEQGRTWYQRLAEWENQAHPKVKEIIQRGGLQGWIRTEPLDHEFLVKLTDQLLNTFDTLHPTQGLRFRSSSNVEDLEGFNGAGLYTSSTGFLYPQAQDADDRHKNIAKALRETWASYWGLEPFEERTLEGIDHLSGWMGVLVHPNFDDRYEEGNGVMILTLLPEHPRGRNHLTHQNSPLRDGSRDTQMSRGAQNTEWIATATLNSQLGAVSVTNPDQTDISTEVINVKVMVPADLFERVHDLRPHHEDFEHEYESLQDQVSLEIDRVQQSTLFDTVLTDHQVRDLINQALKTTIVWWLEDRNHRSVAQWSETLTLDFEYRHVSSGWPRQRADRDLRPQRLVLKQARPLEPAPRGLDQSVWDMPIPLDVVRRAELIEHWSCVNEHIEVEVVQAFTSTLAKPDLGFSEVPFISQMRLTDHRPHAWNQGVPYTFNHTQLIIIESTNRQKYLEGQWLLRLYRHQGVSLPFEMITFKENQPGQTRRMIQWIPRTREGELEAIRDEEVSCERDTIYASPNLYLSRIADEAKLNRKGYGSHIQTTP